MMKIYYCFIFVLIFGANGASAFSPVCQNANSDVDNDGWGWENGNSCTVPATSAARSGPVCSASAIDYDNDGWAWENGNSCVVAGSAVGNSPVCSASIIDYDNDGWAWENGNSCVVSSTQSTQSGGNAGGTGAGNTAVCSASAIDYDNDGWAFENGRSCTVPVRTSTSTTAQRLLAAVPSCSASAIDYDGNGWAFENGRSCLFRGSSSSSPVVQTTGSISSGSGTRPVGVRFDTSTLRRVGGSGDNWCQTWAADGSVITAMDDGDWITRGYNYHSRLYKIYGNANNFTRSVVWNYPNFHTNGDGWFAYGMLSVNGVLYSLVSKTQQSAWSEGPFRGMKMLRSYDSGNSWHRVDQYNNDRYLSRDDSARELLTRQEMFFFEEQGRYGKGKTAYPFSFASFVQSGQDHRASKDGYVYIYSPEGANSNQLQLARVPEDRVGQRSAWQYFSGWNGSTPTWSSNIGARQPNMVLPERNSRGEYFGWYSWLPSVVWNPGLQKYVMVNGGTYGGNLSNSSNDYYDKFMHNKTGSLGFWHSDNPYGPWTQFYYNDYWTADDGRNLTYQPKLSPKWISSDGRRMTLIWSDAMRNAQGFSHSINYLWNQMEIEIQTGN